MLPFPSWDRPFPTDENDKGKIRLILPNEPTVNVEKIRAYQQELVPIFKALHASANEILDISDPLSKITNKRYAIISVHFRLPDQPDLLNEFIHTQTAHIVTLVEPARAVTHPLVDQICPTIPYATLPVEKRKRLLNSSPFDLARDEDLTGKNEKKIRVILPEVLHLLIHWLTTIETPIISFRFEVTKFRSDQGMLRGWTAARLG